MAYRKLSAELTERILHDRAMDHVPDAAVRRDPTRDRANLWRGAFVRDVDKILHHPYYNRYTDKTQVFSLYKNDDLTRRALHVQLVSRIARSIGAVLGLDLDLIEAIALGHDIGHTPFGHAGERYLSAEYHSRTGRYFNHNVQSVRILDTVFRLNISLQTLDGILCHNGELELAEYRPRPMADFADLDARMEAAARDQSTIRHLIPCTMEGCVVRICDILAYIGKDRQDALRAGILRDETSGAYNSRIINDLAVNLIENSYGKDCLRLDDECFAALRQGKRENYDTIYLSDKIQAQYDREVAPIFSRLYEKLLRDAKAHGTSSLLFRHHVAYINERRSYYGAGDYGDTDPNDMVVDFIASMTDDYCIDLYAYLFPNAPMPHYVGYFDED